MIYCAFVTVVIFLLVLYNNYMTIFMSYIITLQMCCEFENKQINIDIMQQQILSQNKFWHPA